MKIFAVLIALSWPNFSSAEQSVLEPRVVFVDPANGIRWTKALQKAKYPHDFIWLYNGCVDSEGHYQSSKCTMKRGPDGKFQVVVEDSDAALACKQVGARLPTKQEYESLMLNFEHDTQYRIRLTYKGIKQLMGIFKDVYVNEFDGAISGYFATSTIFNGERDWAYSFDQGQDGVYDPRYGKIDINLRYYPSYVRCVKDPAGPRGSR